MPLTTRLILQVAFAVREPPEKVIVEDPATAVKVPPQVFCTNGGCPTTRPEGRGSVNAIPVIAEVALLL